MSNNKTCARFVLFPECRTRLQGEQPAGFGLMFCLFKLFRLYPAKFELELIVTCPNRAGDSCPK